MGEALVSVLDEKGVPTIVDRANILPPRSSMNAADPSDAQAVINASPLKDKYTQVQDRRSAYEVISEEQEKIAEAEAKAKEEEEKEKERAKKEKEKAAKKKTTSSRSSSRKKTSALEKTINSAANTVGREIGKSLIRGILGTLKK